ncbi:hypothetical protein HD806DRAFT_477859 [Xylariaceae sp. AK1471]|nr:hypothetical protein HD806DRAFT_477859 [Xylariaceae sp. AK1471]
MSCLQDWYRPEKYKDGNPLASIVDNAFEEASQKFLHDINQRERKSNLITSTNTMEDVQRVVAQSMKKYDGQRKHSAARLWLHTFSQKVKFYGNILDVFAQHHPEYVSLAWGAMKFLFTAVINHEKTVTTIAQALTQIADTLPQVELSSILYPTEQMSIAVADLYSYVLKFLVRAYDWYEEGALKHMLHSITKPVELQYADLLGDISRCSRQIKDLSFLGQQAETRDMHDKMEKKLGQISASLDEKLDQMNAKVERISTTIALQSTALINTNDVLTDMQFSQIMASITELPIWDPAKSFQYHQSLRFRRSHNSLRPLSNRFWQSPRLRKWFMSQESHICIIIGNFQSRFSLRNFCVDVINQINSSQVPVLLALRVTHENSFTQMSSVDLLKYLVRQALHVSQDIQTEKSMSLSCARFYSARSERQWFQNLKAVISAMGRPIYLVIDLEMLDRDPPPFDDFSWLSSFLEFISELNERCAVTRIKVLLFAYGAELPFRISNDQYSEFVIQAKTEVVTVRQQKARRRLPSKGIPFRLVEAAR